MLTADVRTFALACNRCLFTVKREKVPRPFGPAVFDTEPSDLVQIDYIDLEPSKNDDKYVLVLRDDHSHYELFFCFPNTDTEIAATAITEWCFIFEVSSALMSYGPAHFKNDTAGLITKGLQVPHHSTLRYCLWSSGAGERLGRELVLVLRSTLFMLCMDHQAWPDLIAVLRSVLNSSRSPQRGRDCPITAFMSCEPTPPFRMFLRSAAVLSRA